MGTKKFHISIMLLFVISCKTANFTDNKAQRVFLYHLGVVENYVNIGYIEDGAPLVNAYKFLEDITAIKGNIDEQYVPIYDPTKKNVRDWRKWFRKNKERLYWNEDSKSVDLKE